MTDYKLLLSEALAQLQDAREQLQKLTGEGFAIIGMSCRFPGGANSPEEFWQVLQKETDSSIEIPSSRWNVEEYTELLHSTKGCLLNVPIDMFDAEFFKISPKEAEYLDPQQRLLLEVTWEALENAGIIPHSANNTLTGVFIGLSTHDYGDLLNTHLSKEEINAYFETGNMASTAAGRIAYTLGLIGPCLTLDTACSSSLVALHQSCNSLRLGECDMAIAGGVNIILSPQVSIDFSQANMLARDGHCKTFDKEADGYVRGEGCGIIILKRLKDALRDHDRILAVVKGSAVNQDGASSGLTVPNGPAQEAVIKHALAQAKLAPNDIDYIEAHGTGTSLGDPIEVHALQQVFNGRTAPLIIGTVKTHIGHLEAAAGIAGVIKTILSFQRGMIPRHLNFQEINSSIDLEAIPAKIPLSALDWKKQLKPRRAGVSSFGFSGTNAHIILEEAPEQDSALVKQPLSKTIFHRQRYWATKLDEISQQTLDIPPDWLYEKILVEQNLTRGKVRDDKITYFVDSELNIHLDNVDLHCDTSNVISLLENVQKYLAKHQEIQQCIILGASKVGRADQNVLRNLSQILSWEYAFETRYLEIMPQASQSAIEAEIRFGYEPVVYLSEKREVEQVVRWQSEISLPIKIETDTTGYYLITGGLGGLGLALAQCLAAAGITHIVLCSRHTPTEQQETILREIRAQYDVEIVHHLVNVSDKFAMQELISSLPMLRGVFHLAGNEINANFAEHTPEQIADIIAPKYAAWILHELTQELPLKYFVLFSSMSSFFGSNRQAAYVIANGYLDALAYTRLKQDLLVTHLHWGAWAKIGMAAKMATPGLIDSEKGLRFLQRIMNIKSLVGVAVVSPEYLRFALNFHRHLPEEWRLLLGTEKSSKKESGFLRDYYANSTEKRLELLQNLIKKELQGVLHLSQIQDISLQKGFFDLGMDSLMAVELYNKIYQTLEEKVVLRPMLIFDYPTIEKLTQQLYETLEGVAKSIYISEAHYTHEPIAVIGLEVRFPGGANNHQLFWENLLSGHDAIRLPESWRWDIERYPYRAGYIDNIDLFGADFFNISAKEAQKLDPQQRILLETSWHALEDAGISPASLKEREVGIFVGISQSDYAQLLEQSRQNDFYQTTGNALNMAPGRLAYVLGTQGPAIAIDTACSSSLVALHEACRSLENHECELAIVAGVNALLFSQAFERLALGNMLSVDGLCKTFDKDANGYVRGEGCGVLILKRAADAVNNQDRIYALIKGSAVNQDGASSGLTVPNGVAQEKVIATALANAGVTPNSVAFVEVHGTGTSLGDPIEVGALQTVYGQERTAPLIVGTVKTHIGHLESAAGIAGAIKTILSLYHEQIPKNLNFRELNSAIHLERAAIEIPLQSLPWVRETGKPRRAGVSSFGFSGTNAHIIFEEAPEQDSAKINQPLAKTKFNRQRYWLYPSISPISLTDSITTHPFLQHSIKIPGREGWYFESMIDTRYPAFIPDHRIYGYPVVAGACYLSMALSLARDFLGMDACQISEIEFIEALVLDKATRLWVSYEETVLKIYSQTAEQEEAVLRAQMKLIESHKLTITHTLQEVHAALKEPFIYSATDHLERAAKVSLQLGPHFHWLEKIDVEEKQWIGKLRKAQEPEETMQYVFYPGLIDSCFQSGLELSDDIDTLTIPLTISSMQVDLTLGQPRWLSAKLLGKQNVHNENWCADFILWNEEGNAVCEIKEFTAQRASKAALERSLQHQLETENIYYLPTWSEIALEHSVAEKLETIVFHDARTMGRICSASESAACLLADLQVFCQATEAKRVIIITEHAYAVHPGEKIILEQSTLNGLIKTAHIEYPALNLQQIDIESGMTIENLKTLKLPQDIKIFAIREQKYYAQNIEAYNKACVSLGILRIPPVENWSLVQSQPGRLESLQLVPSKPIVLAELEVEIEVHAVGLNFRDVLVALNLYPGDGGNIGGDCAGVITRVGASVQNLSVGDKVWGVGWGAFSRVVRADARLVMKLPQNFSYEQGASIITPLLTAYYGLCCLAQVKPGDHVLIHTGAGAVGLWAIQLMLQRGVNLYVTASTSKQNYLQELGVKHVFDSRTTDYAQAILTLTQGKGVNVVLNTLTSTGFKEATLTCLAQYGRWIEISKRDIYTKEELYKLRHDVVYHTIAIDTMYVEEPQLIRNLLEELQVLLQQQVLKPIPIKEYSITHLPQAIKYLQQGKNIGKIIITLPSSQIQFKDNACYLITGGMGGIGLKIAQFLRERGAGRVVVAGRHLCPLPAEIEGYVCDVNDKLQVENLIQYCHTPNYPLTGIFHLAGIIEDAPLDKQTVDSLQKVFSAKAQGAWYLHEASQAINLDYFVLFSSIASLLGSAGQANYASANSYLDGLAEYRRHKGLKALSINWGPWREVGMAKNLVLNHERQGLQPLKTNEALKALAYVLQQEQSQLGIMHWKNKSLNNQAPSADFVKRLQTASAEERKILLKNEIINEVNKVLGKTGAIDESKGFFEMGMDSLMTLDLKNRMQMLIGRPLANTLTFNYPSVETLLPYLLEFFESDEQKNEFESDISEEELMQIAKKRVEDE